MLLDRFVPTDGSVVAILAAFNPEDEAEIGTAATRYHELPSGGVYDLRGTTQIMPGERTVRHTGLVLEQTAPAFQALMDGYRSLYGKRGRLYALTEAGQPRWADARVVDVLPVARTPQSIYRFTGYWAREVETRFDLLSPVWYGVRHGLVEAFTTGLDLGSGDMLGDVADQVTLDTTPKTFTLTNEGNAPVTNIILTITAVGTPITSLRLQSGLADWTWAGSVAVGQTLTINVGAWSITNHTTPAYSGLTRNAGQLQSAWLTLMPGSNNLTVTREGGANSTFLASYNDSWM
jgi:hypothetical protein